MAQSQEIPRFGYVRCSTEEQEQSGLGVTAQWKSIFGYCQSKSWPLIQRFEDLGESGSCELKERPQGAALLAAIRQRPAIIIVAKLDRLFRNSADGCAMLGEWFQRGIRLVSIAEGIDLTTPYGRFFARLNILFAELERELISQRTKDAMGVKRQRGERISRDPPYGMEFVASPGSGGDGQGPETLRPSPDEWRVIFLMRQLRKNKLSYREIAVELDRLGHRPRRGGTWSHTSVRKILMQLRNVPAPKDLASVDDAGGPGDATQAGSEPE